MTTRAEERGPRAECPGSRYLAANNSKDFSREDYCPQCGARVAVRRNGRLRSHLAREAVSA